MDAERPRYGPLKRALFPLVAIALSLGALEGGLRLARPLWAPADGSLAIDDARFAQLSDTVAFLLSPGRITAADDELIFRLRPNPGGAPINGYEGIDARGFRSGPVREVAGAARTVLLAGDSCAFGWGIPRFDETLGAKLERCLEGTAVAPVRVVNVGQPGHSTSQARLFLEKVIPATRPAVVVLYLGWNDLWETRGLDDDAVLDLLRLGRRPPMRWVRASATYRFLDVVLHRTILRGGSPRSLAIVGSRLLSPTSGRTRVPLDRTQQNLAGIALLAKEVGAELIFVDPPFDHARPELAPMQELSRGAIATMYSLGLGVVLRPRELSPEIGGSSRAFQPDGYHPNAEGAAILAKELCGAVVGRLGA